MKIHAILNTTDHRPWELPKDNWRFYQEWNNAIFLHYQADLTELRKFVPKELEIDVYDDKPWVSVVAFTMEKVRPKHLPAISSISDFDEVNIRTYVKANGKTGVYFLSIEGGKKLSCKLAKSISELPYRFSEIQRTQNTYISRNPVLNDSLEIRYSIGNELTGKSELDKWLTERYALFQDTNESINEFEIHHMEWPINQIDIHSLNVDYPRFGNLIGTQPSKAHYSKGVQVIAWGKRKIEKTGYNNGYST